MPRTELEVRARSSAATISYLNAVYRDGLASGTGNLDIDRSSSEARGILKEVVVGSLSSLPSRTAVRANL